LNEKKSPLFGDFGRKMRKKKFYGREQMFAMKVYTEKM